MPQFYLTVTPVEGETIGGCARDAIRLANLLGVSVRFRFNETECRVQPGDDDLEALLNGYHSACIRSSPEYIVYGRPIPKV